MFVDFEYTCPCLFSWGNWFYAYGFSPFETLHASNIILLQGCCIVLFSLTVAVAKITHTHPSIIKEKGAKKLAQDEDSRLSIHTQYCPHSQLALSVFFSVVKD